MPLPVLTALLLFAAPAWADDGVPTEGSEVPGEGRPAETEVAADEPAERKGSGYGRTWLVVPGAFYGQETSLGFALYGSVTFPMPGIKEGTWPSTISSAVVATLKKQVSFAAWPTLYFGRDNAWIASGSYIVSHFPTRYYGIGTTSDAVYQDYTRRWVLTETSVMRKVAGPLYLGAVDHFSATGLRDFGDPVHGDKKDPAVWTGDDQLGVHDVVGESGGLVHGLGVRARVETRDNGQSTRRGAYADARFVGYDPALGSAYGYTETLLDVRGYHTFGPDFTVAGQWVTELRTGSPPFTHMGELGGDNVLRGMYEGRLRDASLTAVQGELRFPIYWRFRGVAFAGVGQVFDDPSDLVVRGPRWTAGGGLRYELDPDTHNTLRLDVGGGPDGVGFIFNFGEAF